MSLTKSEPKKALEIALSVFFGYCFIWRVFKGIAVPLKAFLGEFASEKVFKMTSSLLNAF